MKRFRLKPRLTRMLALRMALSCLIVWTAMAARASADELVAIPFDCAVEQGQVRLIPGSERVYPVLGVRESQPFVACVGPNADDCRKMRLHRFDMMCSGTPVGWANVVAAAGGKQPWVASLDGGRLALTLQVRPTATQRNPCAVPVPTSGARLKGRVVTVDGQDPCASAVTFPDNRVVFPLGFAPALNLKPRFIGEIPSPPASVMPAHPEAVHPMPAVPAVARLSAADLKPTPSVPPVLHVKAIPYSADVYAEPLPRLALLDVPTAVAEKPLGGRVLEKLAELSWQTSEVPWATVMAKNGGGFAVIALLGLMLVAGRTLDRQGVPAAAGGQTLVVGDAVPSAINRLAEALSSGAEPGQSSVKAEMDASPAETDEWATAIDLKATAGALSDIVNHIVDDLVPEGPLRDVLRADLDRIDQTLTSRELAEVMAGRQSGRAREMLGWVVAELQRVRTLARIEHERTSAALTLAQRPPLTREEAYQFLGVNPRADARVAKKVVDALRLNWHPDQAKDEQDRLEREDRIKQINGAWDLIKPGAEAASSAA